MQFVQWMDTCWLENDNARVTLVNNIELTKEIKDKKTLIKGICVAGDAILEGKVIYYPFYAAIPVEIDHKQLHIVHLEDVVLYEEADQD